MTATVEETIKTQLHEILQEDVEDYIRRNLAEGSNRWAGRRELKERLAAQVGIQYRQFMRYLTGDASFPLHKVVVFCRAVGSRRALGFLAHELGAALILLPAADEIDDFDLVEELSRNIGRAAEQFRLLADLLNTKPSARRLRLISAKTREMVRQALRCEAICRAAIESGVLRARRARKAHAAGQGSLFNEEFL